MSASYKKKVKSYVASLAARPSAMARASIQLKLEDGWSLNVVFAADAEAMMDNKFKIHAGTGRGSGFANTIISYYPYWLDMLRNEGPQWVHVGDPEIPGAFPSFWLATGDERPAEGES